MENDNECYKLAIGDDIYILVSIYKNYPSISIRKCFTSPNGVVSPSKEGFNLITPQYSVIKGSAVEISEVLSGKKPTKLQINLGHGSTLLVERKKKASFVEVLFDTEKKPNSQFRLIATHLSSFMRAIPIIDGIIENLWLKINPMENVYVWTAATVIRWYAIIDYRFENHYEDFGDLIQSAQCTCMLCYGSEFGAVNAQFEKTMANLGNNVQKIKEIFTQIVAEQIPKSSTAEIERVAAGFEQKYLRKEKGVSFVRSKATNNWPDESMPELKLATTIEHMLGKINQRTPGIPAI